MKIYTKDGVVISVDPEFPVDGAVEHEVNESPLFWTVGGYTYDGSTYGLTQRGEDYLASLGLDSVVYFEDPRIPKREAEKVLTDTDLINGARGVEDLVSLLISKNVILMTELPQAMQERLVARENARQNV